ncbi:hypothetical protein BEWA_021040 [Theileria equi strain WA]|uniref:YTH domain-containing protein n=1 Tax=Theileria equi strain WA TaxID=1537102 RepID=L0AUE7_THEEQ|nr:hypothetical protein BEWA_021040 [Theileria equi strain WA]AFZ79257.1 hypothetical protein BEWA_021040 [Theileria equi strain WA]|eukprot:XP_004828923.1 hypothetical protein BEWA_021040 [Theileria equi strain WA]
MDLSQYLFKNVPHSTARKIYRHKRTLFYIVNCFSEENVVYALKYDAWATTSKGDTTFKRHLSAGLNVVVFFSLQGTQNSPSKLVGYALIRSKPGVSKAKNVFKLPSGKTFRGRTFDILWLRCFNVPETEFSHLKNKLDEKKHIKVGPEILEIDSLCGYKLCKIFEKKFLESDTSAVNPQISLLNIPSGTHDINLKNIFAANPRFHPLLPLPILPGNPKVKSSSNAYSFDIASEFNPALLIFPVDLSNMSYDTYISLYQRSNQYWLNTPDRFKELSQDLEN